MRSVLLRRVFRQAEGPFLAALEAIREGRARAEDSVRSLVAACARPLPEVGGVKPTVGRGWGPPFCLPSFDLVEEGGSAAALGVLRFFFRDPHRPPFMSGVDASSPPLTLYRALCPRSSRAAPLLPPTGALFQQPRRGRHQRARDGPAAPRARQMHGGKKQGGGDSRGDAAPPPPPSSLPAALRHSALGPERPLALFLTSFLLRPPSSSCRATRQVDSVVPLRSSSRYALESHEFFRDSGCLAGKNVVLKEGAQARVGPGGRLGGMTRWDLSEASPFEIL